MKAVSGGVLDIVCLSSIKVLPQCGIGMLSGHQTGMSCQLRLSREVITW